MTCKVRFPYSSAILVNSADPEDLEMLRFWMKFPDIPTKQCRVSVDKRYNSPVIKFVVKGVSWRSPVNNLLIRIGRDLFFSVPPESVRYDLHYFSSILFDAFQWKGDNLEEIKDFHFKKGAVKVKATREGKLRCSRDTGEEFFVERGGYLVFLHGGYSIPVSQDIIKASQSLSFSPALSDYKRHIAETNNIIDEMEEENRDLAQCGFSLRSGATEMARPILFQNIIFSNCSRLKS